MSVSTRVWIAFAVLATLSCAPGDGGAAPAQQEKAGGSRLPIQEIKLPPGFKIDVFSDQVPNARQMALSPGGILGNDVPPDELLHETFAEGWLRQNGKAWGRPADVLVMPDGALLVSDDEAGAIYRITYAG